ncbi:MAG TPA: hypothetical protein ENH82_06150 [bacterium]|nr:hypothetical protein [bacterium]
MRKDMGMIADWWYEDQGSLLELHTGYRNNIKMYLPDFTILTNEGEYEFEETKGWFPPKDYTKIKLALEQYDNPITLIFANLTNCKSNRPQYNRAMRLKPHLETKGGRLILDAGKSIFKPIQFMFEY